ncbi:hypothetical protein COV18_00760 [Candidatus Woesearchaeota archaeon CG10_big_fil_rev_8_21_14_0_10_37_12]|nr:MAG: hypothetical protein COV18_00760 [Candidatus Woesearchaeota archaeon CG10_big_fil_rev_8_21_14_0_10_37_12]
MKKYNTIGWFYDYLDYFSEKFIHIPARKKLWSQVRGKLENNEKRILDAGCGTGANMLFYPRAEIHAIDASHVMLNRAKKRAEKLHKKVKLAQMDLTKITYPSNYFDAIVCTFVLCVMQPEVEKKAIKELHRVLKKSGKLFVLDYTYSKSFWRRLFQKLFAEPIFHLLYGVRLGNPTVALVSELFEVKKVTFLWTDVLRLIVVEKGKRQKNE